MPRRSKTVGVRDAVYRGKDSVYNASAINRALRSSGMTSQDLSRGKGTKSYKRKIDSLKRLNSVFNEMDRLEANYGMGK